MQQIPFWNRLSTRLSVLILVIVLVLALATSILVIRAFNQLGNGIIPTEMVGVVEGENGFMFKAITPEVTKIAVATVINLIAIFLLTLVGATVYSRNLLTEPINSLVSATRELASGNFDIALPIKSRNEIGILANSFDQMSLNLKQSTKELLESNIALKESEAKLERRVEARTKELNTLLELSNRIALTLQDIPLIEQIFDELDSIASYKAAVLYEKLGDSCDLNDCFEVVKRGEFSELNVVKFQEALDKKEIIKIIENDYSQIILPVIIHDNSIGVLVLEFRPSLELAPEKIRLLTAFANQAGVALENMKLYARAQEKAAFDERQHLARELHDSVSQALYSIVLGSHAAKKQLERNPKKAVDALEYVQNLAEAGLAEMRALIFELRPEVLEQEGLQVALSKQVQALEVRHNLKAEFEGELEPNLVFASKQSLLRIVQEALHNIVKHASASEVKVSLLETESKVKLIIADDGIGFNSQADFPGHWGLKSMQERSHALGGSFYIESKANQGTVITIEVPSNV